MQLFTVICRDGQATFKVHVAAESADEAIADARRRGHVVDQVLPASSMTRSEAADMAARFAFGKVAAKAQGCTRCGYSLDALELVEGVVTCPECGLRQSRGRSK